MELGKRLFITTAAIVVLVLVMVISACSQGGTTTTITKPGATSTVTATAPAVKEVFKVLNPQGVYIPVEAKALAPRLNSLVGKNIWWYQSEANPVIMPVLLERLKKDYPTATFRYFETQGWGTDAVTADELKGIDAVIRGIGW
jgi:hypothetical protein